MFSTDCNVSSGVGIKVKWWLVRLLDLIHGDLLSREEKIWSANAQEEDRSLYLYNTHPHGPDEPREVS